jgi:hypothetical protein
LVQEFVVGGRRSEQPLDAAPHPIVSHKTTSVHECSYAATTEGSTLASRRDRKHPA